MNSRKSLAIATCACIIVGFVFVLGVLFSSLLPSEKTRNENEVIIPLSSIASGKVQSFVVANRPLFVFRPTEAQRHDLAFLDRHVKDTQSKAYDPELDAFVYWGVSTNRGCDLEHLPSQVSPLKELGVSDAQWFGGFWSVGCELSYDYAGRVIDTHRFTFNGYQGGGFANLSGPRLKLSGDFAIIQSPHN